MLKHDVRSWYSFVTKESQITVRREEIDAVAQFNHLLCGNSQAGFHEFMNSRLFPRTRTSKLFHVTLHDRAVFAASPRNLRTVCVRTRKRGNYALTVQHYRRQDRRTMRASRSPGRWRVTVCSQTRIRVY